MARLTPAERSVVAIARALDGWDTPRNVLVLDEPTAALHGEEVETLLAVVRQVADDGAGIVYVSHRLDEVVRLADRVVVLRDGAVAATRERGGYDHDDLVAVIAGRALGTAPPAGRGDPDGDGRAPPSACGCGACTPRTCTGWTWWCAPGRSWGSAGWSAPGRSAWPARCSAPPPAPRAPSASTARSWPPPRPAPPSPRGWRSCPPTGAATARW